MAEHNDGPRIGILLMNTGTPDEPSEQAIARYLGEFLMDPVIIRAPYPLRKFIVSRIRKHRPAKTVGSYRAFWTEQGSPFMAASYRQGHLLESRVAELVEGPVSVAVAMRYGNPSIEKGLRELRERGCERIVLLPSYPQYARVCAGTCLAQAQKLVGKLGREGWNPRVFEVRDFYKQPAYQQALAKAVARAWTPGPKSHLIVSFHSTLLADIEAGDPYLEQTRATCGSLVAALGIDRAQVTLSYQSRFDNRAWLQPSTESEVRRLAKQGVRDLCIVCPGFTAANVETAIEVGQGFRAEFLEAAGDGASFAHVPELDDDPGLIEAMACAVVEALS